MHLPMRIQPIDDSQSDVVFAKLPPQSSVSKSRLRRFFDRPFKREIDAVVLPPSSFEPSSLCLDKMVRNFIEDTNNNNDKAVKCGRTRCNCFNGNNNESSDDEDDSDFFSDSVPANSSSVSDCFDTLKSLIPCASVVERNLLADTSKIVEKNSKTCKRKDDLIKLVTESLTALGYDASVCVSKWEKSSSIPAGEYEYIDVIINGERLIIDVDFRAEFEIARSTSPFKQILQSLPIVFVGKTDRLIQIVVIASEAARQSLKKKGMNVGPWRKSEYMKSKWLGPYTRKLSQPSFSPSKNKDDINRKSGVVDCDELTDEKEVILPNDIVGKKEGVDDSVDREEVFECEIGELDLIFGDEDGKMSSSLGDGKTDVVTWQLPAVRGRSSKRVVVTGLASLLKEKL